MFITDIQARRKEFCFGGGGGGAQNSWLVEAATMVFGMKKKKSC